MACCLYLDNIIAHHDKYISVVKTFDITEDANTEYIKLCAEELIENLKRSHE